MDILFHPIGTIHTPYTSHNDVPHQPNPEAAGTFYIELNPELADGLYRLDSFNYIQVFFFLDRPDKPVTLHVHPPAAGAWKWDCLPAGLPAGPTPSG